MTKLWIGPYGASPVIMAKKGTLSVFDRTLLEAKTLFPHTVAVMWQRVGLAAEEEKDRTLQRIRSCLN